MRSWHQLMCRPPFREKSAPLAYPDSSDASQAHMEAMVFVTQPFAASILALTLLVLW
ncbi:MULTISPECIES: hypothetical protein [unclassified Pseudomonas]|uniref:hypothetical protein n=1 Tax=unclassified Pseudomonas TaxID=196821 RepID=UPI001C4947A7